MAMSSNNQELKQIARTLIGRGRVDIDAEIHELQWNLKPRNLARSALTRAPAIVIGGAFLVGVVIAVNIYNPTHEETTVAVYAMRAKREAPFISAPVTWEELENDPIRLMSITRFHSWIPASHAKSRLPSI